MGDHQVIPEAAVEAAKAKRSLRFAHQFGLVALAFGSVGAWGLVTGNPALSPAQGLIALVAGTLSGLAYRTSARWERIAKQR